MPASPGCTTHLTTSGCRIGTAPIACSSLGLRISVDDDWSLRHSVLWLTVERATARACASGAVGRPALTSNRSLPVLISNDRLPAQALPATSRSGGAPASMTITVAPRAMRRYPDGGAVAGDDRRAVVVGQRGGQRITLREADAVEPRRQAVAQQQRAQHRCHARDGRRQRRFRLDAARAEALPQRQQIEHQLDEGRRVAADVAAVGEDLALQLGRQRRHRVVELAIAAGDAQIGLHQLRSAPAGADSRPARSASQPTGAGPARPGCA